MSCAVTGTLLIARNVEARTMETFLARVFTLPGQVFRSRHAVEYLYPRRALLETVEKQQLGSREW